MARLGLDIGGANIKWFHSLGHPGCKPFAMWRTPLQLAAALIEIAEKLPPAHQWGVTMTGEMADVFGDRNEGVQTIIRQTSIAADTLGVEIVLVYAIPGNFLSPAVAINQSETVASANWHALANWTSTWIDRESVLIDIGTTTVDLIPVAPNRVATSSITDYDRLLRRELVYLGGKRTPVCSLVTSLPFARKMVPVMREVFANTDDCSLLLDWTPEDRSDMDTCDGKPRTRQAAASRLARMIGLDSDNVTIADARLMAVHVFQQANQELMAALETHSRYAKNQWIVSGHADRLLHPQPGIEMVNLSDRLGPLVSRVGPAYAVCELLRAWSAPPESSTPSVM